MKIALAAGIYPPDIGGPATYAKQLVDALPAQGVMVEVVPYHSVRQVKKVFRHLAYIAKLWRASQDVDLIYALDGVSVGIPAAIVAFLRGIPLVVRLGGDYAWEQGVQRFGLKLTLDEYTKKPHQATWPVRVLAGLQRLVVKRAVNVVLPSQYLKSIVSTWRVDEDKLKVIYSAEAVADVTLDESKFKDRFSSDDKIVVSIGRLTPWKGMEMLIKLIARWHQQGEKIKLIIGGDGPDRAKLEALVDELAVRDSVEFTGALAHNDTLSLIKAAHVFVLNTAYEGLSHVLIEAMSLGTPIITTAVGGNSELITDGQEGVLVPFDDIDAFDNSIKSVLFDTELRLSLVKKAQNRAKQFGATDAVPQVAQLLKCISSTN